nr:alcohol dehydrogenase catalytic domain-containing protein [Zoogloea sp.]
MRHRPAHPPGRRTHRRPRTVQGHEGVGVIESVGAGVTTFAGRPGLDLLHHQSRQCEFCRKGMYSTAPPAAGSSAT